MNRTKIFIGLSAIISLAMSYVSISDYFIELPFSPIPEIKSIILGQLTHAIFRLKSIPTINLILVIIFLLNTVSLILYFFKMKPRVEISKYFSFGCMLLLIMGSVLFINDICYSTIYYENHYQRLTLIFSVLKWMPQVLEFFIPTIYLICVQIYILKQVCVKLDKKTTLISIYIASIIFLTIITFCELTEGLDKILDKFNLKTARLITWTENPYYVGDPNVGYYLCYVLAITILFAAIYGLSELFSRKKRKKQMQINV